MEFSLSDRYRKKTFTFFIISDPTECDCVIDTNSELYTIDLNQNFWNSSSYIDQISTSNGTLNAKGRASIEVLWISEMSLSIDFRFNELQLWISLLS